VRLCLRGRINNIHLFAIPLRESHTGFQMESVVDALMVELCGREWKGKLIGIAADGARIKKHHGTWEGRLTSSSQRTNSQKTLQLGDDNHKCGDAPCMQSNALVFCSRGRLAAACNPISCAMTSLFLPPSPFASSLERPLANGAICWRPLAKNVPCSKDSSQIVLVMARVVILYSLAFCFPIALSAQATTRGRRLLENSTRRPLKENWGRVRDRIMTMIPTFYPT
jgi:hypothetical protein